MFNLKRSLLLLLVVCLITAGLAAPAGAVEVRSGQMVTVPAGRINGPLFVAGNNVVINADVEGDVFAAGESITVNGRIDGDLLAAARSIVISGPVAGDVRCGAQDVSFKGEVGQSLTAAAETVRVIETSRVNGDMLVFAANADLAGSVGGEVMGSAGNLGLNGQIGSDVTLWGVQNLNVSPTSTVGGSLFYRSEKEAAIPPEAKIAGGARWEQLVRPETRVPQRQEGFDWLGQLAWFAAGVLVWGVFALLFPRLWMHLSRVATASPGPALGWGLLALLLTPIAVLLLLITVIGIPLSLMLLIAYLTVLFAAKIIVGDAVGRYLSQHFGWGGAVPVILPFLIGYLALILLTSIPVVGFFIQLAAACLALGAVCLSFYRWRNEPPAVGTVE